MKDISGSTLEVPPESDLILNVGKRGCHLNLGSSCAQEVL